jgi:hypothetical protein
VSEASREKANSAADPQAFSTRGALRLRCRHTLDGERVATLGAVKLMTCRLCDAYVDEACALPPPDEFKAARTTYERSDVAVLRSDLGYVRMLAAA